MYWLNQKFRKAWDSINLKRFNLLVTQNTKKIVEFPHRLWVLFHYKILHLAKNEGKKITTTKKKDTSIHREKKLEERKNKTED